MDPLATDMEPSLVYVEPKKRKWLAWALSAVGAGLLCAAVGVGAAGTGVAAVVPLAVMAALTGIPGFYASYAFWVLAKGTETLAINKRDWYEVQYEEEDGPGPIAYV